MTTRVIKWSFICASSLLILTGCSKSSNPQEPIDPPNPNPDPNPIPTYFEFNTTADYSISIDLATDALNPGITKFDLYAENPFTLVDGYLVKDSLIKPIQTGFTDINGKYSDLLRIPTHIKSVYLTPYKIGIPELLSQELMGSSISFDLTDLPKSGAMTKTSFIYNTINAPSTYAYVPWDALGKPESVYMRDVVPQALLNDISTTLPESALPVNHPEFFNSNAVHQLRLKETCEIDLAFVHEGAGWLNVLGYYYYPTDNPPTSLSNVRKYIAFPNSSYSGSGGGLATGDRIRLKYWNGTEYTNIFPAGITVGWFIYANGYNASAKTVNVGNYMHTSNPTYNLESNPSLRQHSVLLKDTERDLLVIGFEDIKRDQSGCDNDFNDAVFYAIPTPFTAIETQDIPAISRFVDTDNDGVGDDKDQFPNDPTLAYVNFYPGINSYATLAYEDLWPSQGDYDMNDLVCDYRMAHYNNAANKIVRIEGDVKVRASGAKFRNGFAFELGVAPSAIASTSITGSSLTSGTLAIDGKGLEANQPKANIPLFDDVFKLFNKTPGIFVNTDMDKEVTAPKLINFSIIFTTPQNSSSVTLPPYNPYMIVDCGNNVRGKEVHLPSYRPTAKADPSLFSTGQDLTNLTLNKYYIGSTNMPFAIHIPESYIYPSEKNSISNTYTHFDQWAKSMGLQYSDWYKRKNGYINQDKLFTK